MSKDIRSFFRPKKAPRPIEEDDDDVIPESPDVQIKHKKKESRRKRIIDDDSDEEIFKNKPEKKTEKSTNKPTKRKLKEVNASDIFNSAPIKRTEPLVKKVKKTETGIHSDEEFDKSLLEIDGLDDLETDKINDNDKSNISEINKGEKRVYEETNIKIESNDKTKSKDTNIKIESRDKNVTALTPKKPKLSEKLNHVESKKDRITNKIEKGPNKDQKRKFSEFIDDKDKSNSIKKIKLEETKQENGNSHVKKESIDEEMDITVNDDLDSQKALPKKRHNRSLNESVLTDEERYERKRQSIDLYHKYLNRSGPKHLGAKQIPEGKPDCLKDCVFLLTGVLDSFEREEIVEAITKYGGSVKNGISKKVTHVLAGEDAGPAKMAKAEELGIKILNEDNFLHMIKEPTSKKTKDIKIEKTPSKKSHKEERHSEREKSPQKNDTKEAGSKNLKADKLRENSRSPNRIKVDPDKTSATKRSDHKEIDNKMKSNNKVDDRPLPLANASMWVEKHKPQTVKQIIGQHGDASNVKKLINWLTKWYVNRKAKLPKPSPWAKNDDGGYYKAALLSGPPGVGKTTTVSLVCKELGFDAVEFNASDTRNKTLIKEQIGELLTTNSLSGYAKGDTGKQAVSKKHVLVMDEVDGMAGNEDRGGLQELIGLIKSTSVPIICMCNDRNSQKMRSLVNYCYDLRFNRPKVDQIKSAMLSICFKEGIKIPPDVLSQLIVAANQDVRQTLNLLSMWAVEPALADADRLKSDAKGIKKDIKLGPWEAVRKVFSAEDHKTMSLHDRSDLFFYDYSLAPLFVQENYLSVEPRCPKKEVLQRISQAADSISCGDLVDARIRRSQAWGLLPLQAMYSSVIPGHALSGHVSGQIQFPGWLGKNSRANKMNRLCQEIHAHTRLSTSGSKSSIFLDYCTHLRDAIVQPLIKDRTDGIDQSLKVLESYHLLREDLESLLDLSLWPGQRNPTVLIDAKVKAAMTRTYNKRASALPYAPAAVKRGRPPAEDGYGLEEDDEEQQEDSDTDSDALIKKKKEKPEKSNSNKEKPSTSKAKATLSKGKSKKS